MFLNSGLISGYISRCIKARPYFHMMLNARVFLNQTMQKWLKLATPYHQSLLRVLLCNIVLPYL